MGCGGDDDGTGTSLNPEHITTDWQVFYIKAVDASRPEGTKDISGLQRWHFHNNTNDGPIGIEIQKIFVSDTAEKGVVPSGAKMVVDFTLADPGVDVFDPPLTEAGVWTITSGANGKATTSVRNDAAYKYMGNIGSGAGVSAAYWGFIIKNVSTEATAETIRMGGEGSTLQNKGIIPLATWFGLKDIIVVPPEPPGEEPVFVEDWTTVYYEIPAGMQVLEFHVNTGAVEIQKIFVNAGKNETGAVELFDFTKTPAYDSGNFWWGAENLDPFISDGKYVLASTGDYKAGGRFGSALFGENSFVGFVIKCAEADYPSGLGDVRIRILEGDTEISVVRISAF
jgi:hypothetical protein